MLKKKKKADQLFFFPLTVAMKYKFFAVSYLSHVCLSCHPTNCRPPGSSSYGVSQARILEWVAISSSREPSQSSLLHCSLPNPVSCTPGAMRQTLKH